MKNKVTLKELLGTHIIIAILVASYYLMMKGQLQIWENVIQFALKSQ